MMHIKTIYFYKILSVSFCKYVEPKTHYSQHQVGNLLKPLKHPRLIKQQKLRKTQLAY